MKSRFLKDSKGFTGVDLTIAIFIIMLFVSVFVAIFYNLYISSSTTKRNEVALGYAVDVFEQIEKMEYSDVTEENIVTYINTLTDNKVSGKRIDDNDTVLDTPYRIEIKVDRENRTLDVLKAITLNVKYNIGRNKENTITLNRIKTLKNKAKDSLGITPLIYENMIPVKYQNGGWYVTTIYDEEWFDYENNKWANVVIDDNSITYDEKTGLIENISDMYVYIPRYAYKLQENNNGTQEYDIKFLDIDNNVKDDKISINVLTTIESIDDEKNSYIQHPVFTYGDKELEGIWIQKFKQGNNQNISDIFENSLATNTGVNYIEEKSLLKNTRMGSSNIFDYE